MEWLKRFLGLTDRSNQDVRPYTIPTWEDIREQRNQLERPQQESPDNYPGREFYEQHPRGRGNPFTSIFGQMDESFGQMNDMFAQMDTMFSQMDGIMKGFHQYQPPGQVIITELPDYFQDEQQNQGPEQRQTPRDHLLKVPDTEGSQDPHFPTYSGPQYPGPEVNDEERDSDSGSFHEGPHEHGVFGGFHVFDPMSLFEGFFRGFGLGPGISPFGDNPEQPMLPGPGEGPSQHHSRDSLLKQDSDLDDKDVTQLFKDGPRYSYDGVGPGRPAPWSGQLSPGQSQSIFRSTSTVRIRRPDGTVREEKKYKDSTGREEVIVTDTRPDDSS